MARVKRGVTAHAKHKKVLKAAKGFYGRRKNTIRIAKQAVENDVHVIGVSSQAGGHKTLVSELFRELGEHDARDIVVAHTVTKTGKIQSRFDGRVVMIDVGMAPAYHDSLAALADYPDLDVVLEHDVAECLGSAGEQKYIGRRIM